MRLRVEGFTKQAYLDCGERIVQKETNGEGHEWRRTAINRGKGDGWW